MQPTNRVDYAHLLVLMALVYILQGSRAPADDDFVPLLLATRSPHMMSVRLGMAEPRVRYFRARSVAESAAADRAWTH